MQSKIAELTEKILKEGVEKGEQQAQQILSDAKAKAAQVLAEAKNEADRIIADARSQAEELKRNVASEIKLSGQQSLAVVKQQILDVVVAKPIDVTMAKTLDDSVVMKDIILTVVQNWKASAGEDMSLEILLPENKRQEMGNSLMASLQKQLQESVKITFSKAVQNGVRIGPINGAFRVALTDEDFAEFFKDFLRPKAKAYLFGDK